MCTSDRVVSIIWRDSLSVLSVMHQVLLVLGALVICVVCEVGYLVFMPSLANVVSPGKTRTYTEKPVEHFFYVD